MREKSNAVLVEEIGRNVIIRFNRPEIRSPLSIDVIDELARILTEVDERPNVGRVVFTGVGNVFASGADLREISRVKGKDAADFAQRGQHLMQMISGFSGQTVAAVNGLCFGGALDLALACDRRIASPAATFSHPGATLGIITGWGGTQRLPRLIGEANSLEMFFTAERVAAADALRMGLIDRIAEDPVAAAIE